MPVLRSDRPPPPNYYADNLCRLLCAVERQYSDILLERERDYVERVTTLPIPALRLYARLLMRRGPLIRADSLDYREVDAVDDALTALVSCGLVKTNPEVPADRWLMTLTRHQLTSAFPRVRAARKNGQVDTIAARYPDDVIRRRVAVEHPVCALNDLELLAALRVLFFGDAHTDLTTFVLEDLGMLRFEQYALAPQQRQFRDRADFDRFLELQACGTCVRSLGRAWDRTAAVELIERLGERQARRPLERMRSRRLNELGHCAERVGDTALALEVYARSTLPPARERRVRLLNRLGESTAANALLETIETAPQSGTERYFGRHFRGPRIRNSQLRELTLRLPEAPTDSVEAAALAALTRNGGAGWHVENALPRGLLGLAFWDVVFAPIEAAFVNPYQSAPLDLYWSDFRSARAELVAHRLANLSGPGALACAIRHTACSKRGVANALVAWPVLTPELLEYAVACVPSRIWMATFDYMLDDLADARTGFPDLALFYGRDRYQFVEVKGPGDQLRREQRLWFEFFAQHGISAAVLRVSW